MPGKPAPGTFGTLRPDAPTCTIAEVVERALEAYESAQKGREPAARFYARLTADFATDLDLEAVLKAERRAHTGPEL